MNMYPPVERNYSLHKCGDVFWEAVKKIFPKQVFYYCTTRSTDVYGEREVIWTDAYFLLQNLPVVDFLNLASDTYYYKHMGRGNVTVDEAREIRLKKEFLDESVKVIKREILQRMSSVAPEQSNRLVRSLLKLQQLTNCINSDTEKMEVARKCLKTLFRLLSEDYNAVVQVLEKLYKSHLKVEDLFTENYSHRCLKYIFVCCVRDGFNFRDFFVKHCSEEKAMPRCPVLAYIISGDYNYFKILIEFGFERYQFHGKNSREDSNIKYEFVKIEKVLRYMHIHVPIQSLATEDDNLQRRLLVRETTYMICASIIRNNPEKWVRCARLLFKSIPGPYLCETEIQDLIKTSCNLEFLEKITDACRGPFSKIFIPALEPRSLKHMSRCAVRKRLAENFRLPSGIGELGLPYTLIDYLDITHSNLRI